MIAEAGFGPPRDGIRELRFTRRTTLPLHAACLVARGVRDALRELFGGRCELVLGEPVAVDAAAWRTIVHDAFAFVTAGSAGDVVLVVPRRDARMLVLQAFGEGESLPDGTCSALERHALGRIATRCATAFDPLTADRRAAPREVEIPALPPCVAYFDLRLRSPLPLTLGIGLVHEPPAPPPQIRLAIATLHDVPVTAHAVFAQGAIPAASFARLRVGDVVRLDTPVGDPATFHLAGAQAVATGTAGIAGTRAAFRVERVAVGGAP